MKSGHSFIIDEVNVFGIRFSPTNIRIRSDDMADGQTLYKYNSDDEHVEISQL